MAQSSIAIERVGVCPDGQHILEKSVDGEYVCSRCGMLHDIQDTENFHGSVSTNTDHYPVDPLMLVPMGSQHDMISPASKGLGMDLGFGSQARDCHGKRVKPQVFFGYVIGQMVGKGSQVYEVERFDLTLSCKDKDGEPHTIMDLKERPSTKTWRCPFCHKVRTIVDVHRYLVPKARKSFTDDTLYRETKMKAHNLSTALQLDPISRCEYGKAVDKAFYDYESISEKILPMFAFFRMRKKVIGLGLAAPQEMINAYAEVLERLRTMLVEPLSQFNEELC